MYTVHVSNLLDQGFPYPSLQIHGPRKKLCFVICNTYITSFRSKWFMTFYGWSKNTSIVS